MKKANWVEEGSKEEVRSKAQTLLDDVKGKRTEKKFMLVRIDKNTVKEVEIK